MTFIALQNKSTVRSDAQVAALVAPYQKFLHLVSEVWNSGTYTIGFVPKTDPVPVGAWSFTIEDTSDVQGAAGYHDDEGKPTLKVFARTCENAGVSDTVAGSHELAEALGDASCALGYQLPSGIWLAKEPCDPVESDQYGFKIDGVLMSDFVTEAWFLGGSGPYDYTKSCRRPQWLLPGGYASVFNNGNWQQVFAQSHSGKAASFRAMTSRRHGVRVARTSVNEVGVGSDVELNATAPVWIANAEVNGAPTSFHFAGPTL